MSYLSGGCIQCSLCLFPSLSQGKNLICPVASQVWSKPACKAVSRQGDCAFACSNTFKELLNFQDGRGKTRKGTVSPQTCTAGLCWFESKSDKAKKDKKRSFTETSCSKKWDLFFASSMRKVFFFSLFIRCEKIMLFCSLTIYAHTDIFIRL